MKKEEKDTKTLVGTRQYLWERRGLVQACSKINDTFCGNEARFVGDYRHI
ncbi:hypothetical protein KSZ_06970 [Dictyobacter formicarum]|uniref:Uncharacterized protein n=1 Tax=Dictyobacter formicarum TaxID=2778368 RepID=A0ABQ3VB38_9CHLR|nr:hypothetical protein KSZ_06970 [Dictyobacter formicarum]